MKFSFWVLNTGNNTWRGPFWFEATANAAAASEALETGWEAVVYFGSESLREATGFRVPGGGAGGAPGAGAEDEGGAGD